MQGNGKNRRSKGKLRAVLRKGPGRPAKEVARSVLGFDKILFTWHALQRMKQRGVSEAEVFSVLESPTKKGLPTKRGTFRWRKDGVDVVFAKTPDKLCIITVIVVEGVL